MRKWGEFDDIHESSPFRSVAKDGTVLIVDGTTLGTALANCPNEFRDLAWWVDGRSRKA